MWAADNWKNGELLKVRQIILKIFQCGNVKRCSKETGTPIIEFWAIATYRTYFRFHILRIVPRLHDIPDERSEVVLDVIIRRSWIQSVIFTSSRHPHHRVIALKTVTNLLSPRL